MVEIACLRKLNPSKTFRHTNLVATLVWGIKIVFFMFLFHTLTQYHVMFFIVTVDDGAILDVQFADFSYPPPDGFDRIMFEKSIL